jgi:hypothetical protein
MSELFTLYYAAIIIYDIFLSKTDMETPFDEPSERDISSGLRIALSLAAIVIINIIALIPR